ncbi:MAG TPA: lipid II flippase MurJ [Nitrospira sp.]|nr:lipid II flippase MurJ [Nitrospira sp.]
MYKALQVGLQWWDTWKARSINRRILSALMTVGALTVLTKIASAGKDLVVAYQFGAGDELDAFLMAFLIPSFAINLIGGSLNPALIPTYIQVRKEEGMAAATDLYATVLTGSVFLLAVTSVILFAIGPFLLRTVALEFPEDKFALTVSLFNTLLPCLLLSGLATTWGAILNAHEQFSLAAIAPAIMAGVTILALLALTHAVSIHALAIGVVAGTACHAALLGWGVVREGIRLRPEWAGITPALKTVWHQYAPMLAGAALIGSTEMIGQIMAASLESGSVSILSYGNKIPMLLLGVASMAASTAVLPYFSEMVAARLWDEIRHTLFTYTRLIALITIPLTVALVTFSEPIIELLFHRGAFTAAHTHQAAGVQSLAFLQITPFALGILAVRLLSSLKANHILMWSSAISLVLSIVLNYLFMHLLGVAGIALATSLMYLVSMCFLYSMVFRQLRLESAGVSPYRAASRP